jgi:uncharacterized protein
LVAPNPEIILDLIKKSVRSTAPDAELILYGSYARGDNREDSDIDILVLVDKEKITRDDRTKITYPLYEIEFETGTVISPIVYSKQYWEKHRITPFYENVVREGRVL